MNRWMAMLSSLAALGLSTAGCTTNSDAMGAPEDQGIPGPPGDPPPTGGKWEGVEVEGECGRVGIAWVVVDEVCAGTGEPGYLDAFHAPIFRDGAQLGDLLYAVDATHLWVLDVADETAVERRAMSAGLGQPLSVASYQGDLIVAAGGEGLLRLDLSDPLAPERSARVELEGPALDVHVEGTTAYVATGSAGLSVVDLAAQPPQLVQTMPIPGFAAGVKTRDGRAYVAACDTFVVVDLASGAVIGQDWLADAYQEDFLVAPAKDVELVGSTAFVAAGRYGAVAVDVTAPYAPVVVGNCTETQDLAFYASGVRAQDDRLFVAGGEWGIMPLDVSEPATTCSLLRSPELYPLPTGDGECSTEPPWQIVDWQDQFKPPPPGRDPIQTLPAGERLYAFGDARRLALRAVDLRLAQDPALTKIGRFDEPRLVTGVWAHGGRVLALGPAGGLFLADPTQLLVPAPEPVVEARSALAAGFLADGRWVVGTDQATVVVEGATSPLWLTEPLWPHGLTTRGNQIVVPNESGARLLSADDGSVHTLLSGQSAELPPAVAVHQDEIFVAAPEWLNAIRVRVGSPEPLPPHGAFELDDIMNANLWRVGLPRRLLVPSPQGLVEVASLAGRAGLALHGAAVESLELPPGTYAAGAASATHLYLVTADRNVYRSQLVTVRLDGATPGLVSVQALTGVFTGVTVDADRLYVADADRGIRVFGVSSHEPIALGLVELEEAP